MKILATRSARSTKKWNAREISRRRSDRMVESSGLCGLCAPCGSISRSGLESYPPRDGRSGFHPQRAHGTQREEISMTGSWRQSDRNAERFWSLRSLRLKFQDGLERHVSREPPSDLQRPRAKKGLGGMLTGWVFPVFSAISAFVAAQFSRWI